MARRIGVALTKRVVDAAEKKDKRYYLWDSELSGFGLRVETSAPRLSSSAIVPKVAAGPQRSGS